MKQSSSYLRVMDISLNLARIGDWAADNYETKKTLIDRFLAQTEQYIYELQQLPLSKDVKPVFSRFFAEFHKLKNEEITSRNKDEWAERALTWANILQHKARLT